MSVKVSISNARYRFLRNPEFFWHSSLLFLLVLLAVLTGCATPKKKPAVSVGTQSITEINMLAVPVALNLDPLPGPDTVAIKIYAGNLREAKPVPITVGAIELLMFDGILKKSTNAP